jgi:hypothetical protein
LPLRDRFSAGLPDSVRSIGFRYSWVGGQLAMHVVLRPFSLLLCVAYLRWRRRSRIHEAHLEAAIFKDLKQRNIQYTPVNSIATVSTAHVFSQSAGA